jgi:hypothetical protein
MTFKNKRADEDDNLAMLAKRGMSPYDFSYQPTNTEDPGDTPEYWRKHDRKKELKKKRREALKQGKRPNPLARYVAPYFCNYKHENSSSCRSLPRNDSKLRVSSFPILQIQSGPILTFRQERSPLRLGDSAT